MNRITVNIDNELDLQQQIEKLDLKPISSLQEICTVLFANSEADGIEEVEVIINPMLVANSYVLVPAMLARSMRKATEYSSLQSIMRDGSLVVIAAHSKRPTTFRARAIRGILKHRIFKASKDIVPKSYRRRPGMMSSILLTETGFTVDNETRENEIVWKVKDK